MELQTYYDIESIQIFCDCLKLNAIRNHKQNLGFQFWLTNLHIQTKVIHIIKSIFRQNFVLLYISIYKLMKKRNMNSNI